MSTQTAFAPSTTKQVAFINSLCEQRDLTDLDIDTAWVLQSMKAGVAADRSTASKVIEALLAQPKIKAAAAQPKAQTPPGYYIMNETVFHVTENIAKTGTYARKMVIHGGKGRWTYVPGAASALGGLEPLTLAQAIALGHQHGACVICGRSLTDPKSVQAGIGPVCAKKI